MGRAQATKILHVTVVLHIKIQEIIEQTNVQSDVLTDLACQQSNTKNQQHPVLGTVDPSESNLKEVSTGITCIEWASRGPQWASFP